jgi:hypothetical protein
MINNPFAHYSTIVMGEKFYGRKEEISQLTQRLLQPGGGGSVSIIGEPKIGKTSLVHQSLLARKDELLVKRIVIIKLAVSRSGSRAEFYWKLVQSVHQAVQESGFLPFDLSANVATIREHVRGDWFDLKTRIEEFFFLIRGRDFRVLIFLDEFDYARHLFKDDGESFQLLRDLSYDSLYSLLWICTSRRPIHEIEEKVEDSSTFAPLFQVISLKPFDEQDVAPYFDRYTSIGILADSKLKEFIAETTGYHPYLMDLLGFYLVSSFINTAQFTLQISSQAYFEIINYYESLKSLLDEEGQFSELLQIVYGPNKSIHHKVVTKFELYGLIVVQKGFYHAFSQHFDDYLRLVSRDVDFWPLWKETEILLRRLVEQYLIDTYPKGWTQVLLNNGGTLRVMIQDWQDMQARDRRYFGNLVPQSILSYSYPRQLFDIMKQGWKTWFQRIFIDSASVWEPRFTHLNRIRNRLAHNNDFSKQTSFVSEATEYCEEILRKIKEASSKGTIRWTV